MASPAGSGPFSNGGEKGSHSTDAFFVCALLPFFTATPISQWATRQLRQNVQRLGEIASVELPSSDESRQRRRRARQGALPSTMRNQETPPQLCGPPPHADVKSVRRNLVTLCHVAMCACAIAVETVAPWKRSRPVTTSRPLGRGVKASLCKSPSKPKYIFPCPPKNLKQRQILSFYKQRMEIHLGDNH